MGKKLGPWPRQRAAARKAIRPTIPDIALNLPADDKERVLGALWRFGLRGIPAARQIQELTWRLGAGTERGYAAKLTLHTDE